MSFSTFLPLPTGCRGTTTPGLSVSHPDQVLRRQVGHELPGGAAQDQVTGRAFHGLEDQHDRHRRLFLRVGHSHVDGQGFLQRGAGKAAGAVGVGAPEGGQTHAQVPRRRGQWPPCAGTRVQRR